MNLNEIKQVLHDLRTNNPQYSNIIDEILTKLELLELYL